MNLQELKSLVAEEYTKYMSEQEDEEKKDDKEKDDAPKGDDKGGDDKPKGDDKGGDDKPKKASTPKVKAGGNDLDLDGEENPEETLRQIYNMLKDFFEGDDKEDKKDDMGAPNAMPTAPAASPKAPAGMDSLNAGMGMYEDKKTMNESINKIKNRTSNRLLQERFKKLANIKK
jgi:hypothetical protein